MRREAACLIFGALAAAGCATHQTDQRVDDRTQWQRVRERCRGDVLLAADIHGCRCICARPESGTIGACRTEVLTRTARAAMSAVVEIHLSDDDPAGRGGDTVSARPSTRRTTERSTSDGPSLPAGGTRTAGLRAGGTGIIIDESGLILTNDHVIRRAGGVCVTLQDGSTHRAELVARDPRRDLAVLRIQAGGLAALVPRALDAPATDEPVVAVGACGCPRDDRARFGKIERRAVSLQGQLDPSQRGYYGHLLETTTAIEPGFSGGPLLDSRGRLVGINVAVARDRQTGELRGYAILLDRRTCEIITGLARGREASHGYLGAYVKDAAGTGPRSAEHRRDAGATSDPEPHERGALIDAVRPDSPAAEAGLCAGDVVVALDGTSIRSADHLVRLVDASPTDRPVEMRHLRGGRSHTAPVRLRARP